MQISVDNQVRVGRELRQERERQQLAVEDMARVTRISVRHIHSLEADLFDELPGGVIRKGIVRSYCQHLGLDEEHWIGRVAEAGGLDDSPPDLAEFAENVHRARVETMPPIHHRWWGVLLLALALACLAYAAWHFVVQPRTGFHLHHGSEPLPISTPRGDAPAPSA